MHSTRCAQNVLCVLITSSTQLSMRSCEDRRNMHSFRRHTKSHWSRWSSSARNYARASASPRKYMEYYMHLENTLSCYANHNKSNLWGSKLIKWSRSSHVTQDVAWKPRLGYSLIRGHARFTAMLLHCNHEQTVWVYNSYKPLPEHVAIRKLFTIST